MDWEICKETQRDYCCGREKSRGVYRDESTMHFPEQTGPERTYAWNLNGEAAGSGLFGDMMASLITEFPWLHDAGYERVESEWME